MSFFKRLGRWFRGGGEAPAPAPADTSAPHDEHDERDEALGWMRDHIDRQLAAGFQSHDDVLTGALETAELDDDADARAQGERYLEAAAARLRAAQRDWPAQTDCDRLNAAFAELERAGVVCRQNFWCCQTCGVSAIGDEMAAADRADRPVRGYAFYHEQDTERAVDGEGLYLSYGSTEADDEATCAIAHEVVDALARHGLKTDWDGSRAQRVFVTLDWKRRAGDGRAARKG